MTMEILAGIALAVVVPLLGGILATLWKITAAVSHFSEALHRAEELLNDNRDEHIKMLGLIEKLEKTLESRIDLLEERVQHYNRS